MKFLIALVLTVSSLASAEEPVREVVATVPADVSLSCRATQGYGDGTHSLERSVLYESHPFKLEARKGFAMMGFVSGAYTDLEERDWVRKPNDKVEPEWLRRHTAPKIQVAITFSADLPLVNFSVSYRGQEKSLHSLVSLNQSSFELLQLDETSWMSVKCENQLNVKP